MKHLQHGHQAAVTIDTLLGAYGSLSISYVSGWTVDEKYGPDRYAHLYAKADAQKAVYDATKECEKAALALDEANEKLIAALRDRRRHL